MIRDEICELVERALAAAQEAGELPAFAVPELQIEHPQRPEHGDYAANLPLRIQGLAKMKALDVAEALRARVPAHPAVGEVRTAPPGFLNFYLDAGWVASQATAIAEAGDAYATSDLGGGRKTQVEYVSANPTGPVHIGNGRGAAIGSTLANVLRATGHEVEEEYYINDAGQQVAIFARTLYARYQQPPRARRADPGERLPRRVHGRDRPRDPGRARRRLAPPPRARRPTPASAKRAAA